MNRSPLLATVLLGALIGASAFAAPKVEETILGPAKAGGIYVVAPKGGQVAYLSRKDAQFTIAIDGVEGPAFDEILRAGGSKSVTIPKETSVLSGRLLSRDNLNSPITFSYDGRHYAYVGRQGSEYVVIHDGKEAGRGLWRSLESRGVELSFGGRQVYWREIETDAEKKTFLRAVVSGKPGPWMTTRAIVAFAQDDNRYAYSIAALRETGQPALIVDGRDAGYFGTLPQFTADGSRLLSQRRVGDEESLLADGQVVATGRKIGTVTTAWKGKRYAAIVEQLVNGETVRVLCLDGRIVPGTEGVEWLWFSGDGQRVALRFKRDSDQAIAVAIDGKRGGFAKFKQGWVEFTAENAKAISWAEVDDDETVVMAEGKQFHYTSEFSGISSAGSHYAWSGLTPVGPEVVVDGKELSLPVMSVPEERFSGGGIQFSPDGSRHAFVAKPIGRSNGPVFVVDGAIVPNLVADRFTPWDAGDFWKSKFEFSADGTHLAFMAREGTEAVALYLDSKAVYSRSARVYFPTFTPDSRHFAWLAEEAAAVVGETPAMVLYVDGHPAVRTNVRFFRDLDGVCEIDDHGVITLLGADGDVVKRYRVTAPENTSVMTLLASAQKQKEKIVASKTADASTSTAGKPAAIGANDPKPVAPDQAAIKAAADGDVTAQLKLGRTYRDGNVGAKDPTKAYFYFTIAAARGSKEAAAERDAISNTMTGEQLRIGFNDAYDWLMSHPPSR